MTSLIDGLDIIEDVLVRARRSQEEANKGLKEEVERLEAQARQKRDEYKTSSQGGQKIVKGELRQVFADIDTITEGERWIIHESNMRKLSLAEESVKKLKASTMLDRLPARGGLAGRIEQLRQRIVAAHTSGTLATILDDIAVRLEEAYREMEDADRAAQMVRDITYKTPETPEVDTSRRLDETEVRTDKSLPPEIDQLFKKHGIETETETE
jgi:hypothetical protein